MADGRNADGRDADGGASSLGGDIVIVAILPPRPSPGGYSAYKPPVGFGPRRITPCSAVVHRWRPFSGRNPPILPLRVREYGLMKGTPRITCGMAGTAMVVAVRLVTTSCLLLARVFLLPPPGRVVSWVMSNTAPGTIMLVTTTKGGRERQVRRSSPHGVRLRLTVPKHARGTVAVSVTMPVAGKLMVTINGLLVAAASSGGDRSTANEGVAGAVRRVSDDGVVTVPAANGTAGKRGAARFSHAKEDNESWRHAA